MLPEVIVVGLIGGIINLDVACVGQLMISRPLVACPLTGVVLGMMAGDPQAGLDWGVILGIILELIWIRSLPVGAHIPPNIALSAVVTVSLVLIGRKTEVDELIVLALLFSIFVGFMGGKVDVLLKKFNLYLANLVDKAVETGKLEMLERINWVGITVAFLAGFLFCVAAIIGGNLLLNGGGYLINKWELNISVFLPLLLLFGIGAGVELFATKKHLIYFGVSFFVTILFLTLWR